MGSVFETAALIFHSYGSQVKKNHAPGTALLPKKAERRANSPSDNSLSRDQ